MLAINNILIYVDRMEPDQGIFKFLSNFTPLLKDDNLKIIYKLFLKESDNNSENKVPRKLQQQLQRNCFTPNPEISLSFEINFQPGDAVINTLRYLSQNNIDLLIINFSEKNREEAVKIIRSSACSVLFLSPDLPQNIDKILVPIDFSSYSKIALNMAIAFAELRKVKLFLNHIYYVPEGYHSVGKSYDEMAGVVKTNAKKEYQKLIKEFDLLVLDTSPSFILDDDKDPTDKIYKEAVDQRVDLIIMSSKGKTSSGSELMGNTAKTLILYNKNIPLLIYKNKKENADLADFMWKTASIN